MNVDKPKLIENLPVFKNVEGHLDQVPFYITEGMFKGVEIEVAGVELTTLINKPIATLHSHDFPEIYLLLSPQKGGAKIQIQVEGEQHILTAPGTFYIPAQINHKFTTLEAVPGSYCLGILLLSKGKE